MCCKIIYVNYIYYNVISVMRVAGPAIFIVCTNRAGVCIVRPTHAKYLTIFIRSAWSLRVSMSTVANVICGVVCFLIASIMQYTQSPC